jgi:hypothetical protein
MDTVLHRRMLVLALGVALALVVAAVAWHMDASAQEPPPPQPVVRTFTVEGACEFPVKFVESGKEMAILLPGGDILRLFPGGRSTLTNVDTGKQVTLRGGGGGRVTLPQTEGGNLRVTVFGHNVLVVPGEGIFEVRKATFTLAPPYDVGSKLTILERRGKLVDLCALLA